MTTTLSMTELDDRPTLLIVDDDQTFCTVLANAMTKRGFNVTCAHSVDQALELAEEGIEVMPLLVPACLTGFALAFARRTSLPVS